jgi:hypothetical protein
MSTSFKNLSVSGHRVKVRLLGGETTFSGSCIYKPDDVLMQEKNHGQEAIVLEIGPQAFQIFGSGDQKGIPWCAVGDKVLIVKNNSVKQDDCMDEEDKMIRVTLDENIIGVFK